MRFPGYPLTKAGLKSPPLAAVGYLYDEVRMSDIVSGFFYFIADAYFDRFNDPYLMPNKGVGHNRPCFYAFHDKHSDLYWMIPISSKTDKYHRIADNKIKRYGYCNTIVFGKVLGQERAFLIQNMFPISLEYIDAQYIDIHTGDPVHIANAISEKVIRSAKTVLTRQRHGGRLIFPNVLEIERQLLSP